MHDQQNSRLKSIEKFLRDEPEDIDIMENQIDTSFDEVFRCIYENILPVCTIALVINLTIIFTLPVEVAMSRWFWLKDPISFLLAPILVRAISYLRDSVQIHN